MAKKKINLGVVASRKMGLLLGGSGSHILSQELADKVNKTDPAKGENALNIGMAAVGAFSELIADMVPNEHLKEGVQGTLDGIFVMSGSKLVVNASKKYLDKTNTMKYRAISGVSGSANPENDRSSLGNPGGEETGFTRDTGFDASVGNKEGNKEDAANLG
jgi:hypothetical protein